MSLLGNIWVKLGLKDQDFNKGLENSEKRAERFGSFLGKVSAKAVLAWGAISAAVIKFTKASIKNYQEAEAANNKLQNALRNTGAAIGVNYDELKDYASQLQKVNGYADDATMSAMATLTTFRSVQGKVFKDTIAAAQDMASFLGTDLNNAVQQLGKALESPEMGITMLRRSGVVFTTEMTENIRKLVKEGKTYEAQMLILEEVNKRFGGEAARQADTAAGAWKRVGMAFGDLTEHIGAATNATKGLANSLASALETADSIISSEALTKWEKFRVIVLGIGQAKAAAKMADFDQASKEMADHATAYAQKAVSGLDTIEKAQKRLEQEQQSLSKATSEQRKADTKAAISAIQAHIEALNQQKAAEEEAAKKAREEAAEKAKELQRWREEHTGLLNELKDEIAAREKLLNMATDRTEIERLREEIMLLQLKQKQLREGGNIDFIPQKEDPLIKPKDNPFKIDTTPLKHTEAEVEAFVANMHKQIDEVDEMSMAFATALENGIISGLEELGEQLGAEKFDTTAVVRAFISPLADTAISAGVIVSGLGSAIESMKTSLTTLQGPIAIAAGAALIAAGVAAKAGLAALARGSKDASSTTANMYTYAGGYGVAPSEFGRVELGATVTVKGQDLQIALDNYNRNRGR